MTTPPSGKGECCADCRKWLGKVPTGTINCKYFFKCKCHTEAESGLPKVGNPTKEEIEATMRPIRDLASAMVEPKDTSWKETLTDLIEKETFYATGDKNPEHNSGSCLMNDIIHFVETLLTRTQAESYERGYRDGRIDELNATPHIRHDDDKRI